LGFGDLCEILEKIEATTKRLEITEILVEFFDLLMKKYPKDLLAVVYLCLSRVSFNGNLCKSCS